MKKEQKTKGRGTQRDGGTPKRALVGKKLGPEGRTLAKLNEQLLNAAERGDLEKVKGALDDGATVDATSINGYTPLMFAAMRKHTKTVELLIERGADVNAQTDKGFRVLEFAEGDSTEFRILRRAGASIKETYDVAESSLGAGC